MILKYVPFLKRYGIYFVIGTIVEAVRLVTFRVAIDHMSFEEANLVSLPLNVLVAFILHGTITWRDRKGSLSSKFIRFVTAKGVTLAIKASLPSLFWTRVALFSCPLHEITHTVVGVIGIALPQVSGAMTQLFTCEWMSLALMDFSVAMTIGFFAHDRFSFWRRRPAPAID